MRANEKEDKELEKISSLCKAYFSFYLFIWILKLKLTNFNDDNIILNDGEDLADSNDIDLRFSMLVNACLSIGYIRIPYIFWENQIKL